MRLLLLAARAFGAVAVPFVTPYHPAQPHHPAQTRRPAQPYSPAPPHHFAPTDGARTRALSDPWLVTLWAVPPIAALAGCLALSRADPARVGGLGLIDAIPPTVLACLALLALGFAGALRQPLLRAPLLSLYVLVLVLLLHGAPMFVEHEPRFATAWLHAGFTGYVAHTGTTLPNLDARFNWPGFFAAGALLLRGLGVHDPRPVLTWAPLLFELVALAPVYAIAAITSDDERVPWLAVWLFVPANWVGQDYFAPQAAAFALFLGFVVLLLRCFRVADDERAPHQGRLLALLLLTYCAIVWSHQLTPYFAIVGSLGLVLVGVCRLRTLPLLLTVIAVAFVSYLAIPYWAGHLHDIVGGVGQLGSNVSASVGNRVSASGAHEWVPRVRMAMAAFVSGVALLGAALRWRRADASRALLVLFAVPFSALAFQSYGGEVLLRAYLFALPFAVALMAAALARPSRPRSSAVMAVVLPSVTVALVLGFYVARFGNEVFEMVRPGEAAAVAHLYRVAPAGSAFVSLDGNVPWRYTQIADHAYDAPLTSGSLSPRAYLVRVREAIADDPAGGYLLVTRGQQESAQLLLGVSRGWIAHLVHQLATSDDFRLVYANRDARLYRYSAPPAPPP